MHDLLMFHVVTTPHNDNAMIGLLHFKHIEVYSCSLRLTFLPDLLHNFITPCVNHESLFASDVATVLLTEYTIIV